MSDRRFSFSMLFLLGTAGCDESGEPLGRLLDLWYSETKIIAEPAMTDALVIAGMAAELCVAGNADDWSSWVVGESPDLSDDLIAALGDPVVEGVTMLGEETVRVSLDGVAVMDREEARVRFIAAFVDTGLEVEALVMDARISGSEQPEGEPFGRLLWSVEEGCSAEASRLTGDAHWTDLDERTHTVRLPSDEVLGMGVTFDSAVPWLPVAGTLYWSARIGAQQREIVTFDAADIVLEDDSDEASLPIASWPAVIGGPDWIEQGAISVNPGS